LPVRVGKIERPSRFLGSFSVAPAKSAAVGMKSQKAVT
jgi:hypothetical protein